ncbi:sigma-70 family RNA polymerase sigma factor [Neorhizobium sp. NCHU2750]|uniref:RNA polymerase sigma factor n=1 Tax=Neorhizobium sp. NCHU2750 TaxID=1825976 RepID=UPI000E7424F7|nr:RNA polymerase sigma factor [Neorhizobium sp. NCHU2750]
MSASFTDIFLSNRKALIGTVVRIVGDHQAAEDVAQEAYVRVSRAVEGGTVEHIEAFLFQTARNLALNHKRSRQIRGSVERDDVSETDVETIASPTPSQEAEIIHRQRLRLLEEAVSRLPERAQKVWVLSKIEKWPYPRIAEHLGVSPNTVFNDLKMAHAHCMDALAKIDRG